MSVLVVTPGVEEDLGWAAVNADLELRFPGCLRPGALGTMLLDPVDAVSAPSVLPHVC
jgi:hypothetical protein